MGRLVTDPAQSFTAMCTRASRAAWGGMDNGAPDEDINSLRAELAEYQAALANLRASIAPLTDENRVLKNRLGMIVENKTLSLALCQVAQRDQFMQYYDYVVINRGLSDGIKKGCHVLSETGLVGVVSETGPSSAKVLLLTSRDFAMPCQVLNRNVMGIIAGSSLSNKEGLSMLQPVPQIVVNSLDGILFDKVVAGDSVTVSATGETGGAAIMVGTVTEVDTSLAGAPVLKITPSASFNQLKYLFVVVGTEVKPVNK